MNIYVAHARKFDFKNELYLPLRQSSLNDEYEILLPHEFSEALFSSKEFFDKECDLLVVEASYGATGVGIEAGWADAYGVPIIAMYRSGMKMSGSLRPMCNAIIEYDSTDEMVSRLEREILLLENRS